MNKNNNKMDLLGNAPVPQALMALGIPIMIGMLINALYNLVDAYFIGGLGESQSTKEFSCRCEKNKQQADNESCKNRISFFSHDCSPFGRAEVCAPVPSFCLMAAK